MRRQVRRERAHLVNQDALTEEEADRLFVLWYPVSTEEEGAQEDQEEEDARNLEYSTPIDQDEEEEAFRPEREGDEGE